MTILYHDPLFQRHQTGHHPECPARLEAIAERPLIGRGLENCAAVHHLDAMQKIRLSRGWRHLKGRPAPHLLCAAGGVGLHERVVHMPGEQPINVVIAHKSTK